MTTDKYLLVDVHPTIGFHACPRVGMLSKKLLNAFLYCRHMHKQILPCYIGMSPVGFMDIEVQVFLVGSRS